MVSLQAGTGFGGAARDFYNRRRVFLLSALLCCVGLVTGTAAAVTVLQGTSLLQPLTMGAGVLLAAGCCGVQTRHAGLTVLTAAAPLAGLLWAAPVSAGANYGAVPYLAYGAGFAVGVLYAQTTVQRALDRNYGEYPWRAAVAATGLTLVLTLFWFWDSQYRLHAVQAVLDTVSSVASALLLLPLGATVLRFDEAFVARANRARERRQRRFERLALLATPRWGFSFTGIALVFLALGWFGAEPAIRSGDFALALRAASVALVAAGAAIFVRGWREGISMSISVCAVCLVSLWFSSAMLHDGAWQAETLLVVAQFLLLALYGGRCTFLFRGRGEPPDIARQRSIEEIAAGQVFAAAGAVLTLLPGCVVWPELIAPALSAAVAGVGAVAWYPAGSAAVEAALPRHRSVEDIYGSRRKSHA